ncbi:MAG TPA: hypothetical protein GX731_01065 [Clostridiales bacterium]|nr:hypothetical protein [Clostridiales bacterium]
MKYRNFINSLIKSTAIFLVTVLVNGILLPPSIILAENTEIVSYEITDEDSEDEYKEDEYDEYNEDEYDNDEFEEELQVDSIIKEKGTKQEKMLVAHYKFEENLIDSSNNKNNGNIAHGEITYENGKNGIAAKFDGESYIEVRDNDSLNLDEAFTISVWVNKVEDEDYGYSPIIAKGIGSDELSPPYSLYHDGTLVYPFLDLHNIDEWDSLYIEDNGEERYNQWYLVTVTFDSKTKKVDFYIDGAFIGYRSWKYGSLYNTDQSLYIGFGEFSGEQEFYIGLMDDLRIYNYALTDKEIKDIYKDVTAEDKVYTSISITPNKMAIIKKDGSFNVNVTGVLKDGKKENITKLASYKSSDTKIVTVSKEGKIIALKKGKANVTVSYGKLKKVLNITVK